MLINVDRKSYRYNLRCVFLMIIRERERETCGQQDGLTGKDTFQFDDPGLDLIPVTHIVEREPAPTSYPLASTYMPWHNTRECVCVLIHNK